jgi:hypothetical protein
MLTEESARSALVAALEAAGLSAAGPTDLIRIGSNAVFYVGDEIVARVAESAQLYENALKQIKVSRWLVSTGYPAVQALEVAQPIETQSRIVTFWRTVSRSTRYAAIGVVGHLIRRLHDLDSPPGLNLPSLEPFLREVPDFVGLSREDSSFLVDSIHWARQRFFELPYVLPPGHVHGDANVGNVILDDSGSPVVIDLDGFSVGPREWDLIQTAIFYDRLGWHTSDEYQAFVDGYGYDITQWEGYAELAKIREIAMTSWLSRKAPTSEATAKEASKRIESIRSGGSRRDWGAY